MTEKKKFNQKRVGAYATIRDQLVTVPLTTNRYNWTFRAGKSNRNAKLVASRGVCPKKKQKQPAAKKQHIFSMKVTGRTCFPAAAAVVVVDVDF